MKTLRIALATLGCVTTAPAMAQEAAVAKPKLIVALAVDQLSTDIFNEYRATYTGGFKRLTSGIVFPRGHQGHAATETCPGHSTILTGSRPARTGIIANDWMQPGQPRKGKDGKPNYEVYCAEDPMIAPAAGSAYTVSGQFLRVPTLGDRMKATDPRTKVVSVSGKDRAAVMMGGKTADLTIWWNGKAFGTYAGQEDRIPAALAPINAASQTKVAKGGLVPMPKQCARYARPVSLGNGASVGVIQPRKPKDERGWRATAEFDQATLDVALAGLAAHKLGKGDTTDLLAISFSATDYVGHSFGTEGAEMCAQIFGLDAVLGKLFAALDKHGVDYVVSLTADHGGHDLPERNALHGLPPAERVDKALAASSVGQSIAGAMLIEGSALVGRAMFGDIYLSPTVPPGRRAEAIGLAASAYRSHRQVEAVFTRDQIIASPAPKAPVDEWSLLERVKASFDPERSGDLLVLLKPYVTPIPDSTMGYVATHGSPWGYDRRVPILFWRKGMPGFEQPNAAETADILPTLASLIALPVDPASIDGRCLDLLAGKPSNCPAK